MYESFFGLARRPFAATPDPDCFVPVSTVELARDSLALCIEAGQGVAVLTAPPGLGKTLLLRRVAREFADSFAVVLLPRSDFTTRRSFLQAVLSELGRPYVRLAEQELRLELERAVRDVRPAREAVLLLLDEAHGLGDRLLEEIRNSALLATDGQPLFRIVLCGQPELEERLADPALAALNQRVACHAVLEPLTRDESRRYLADRLAWAGGRLEDCFEPDAVELVCRVSDGIPRCLNHLADHSLLLAFVNERRPVPVELVREALDDLRRLPLPWNEPLRAESPSLETLQRLDALDSPEDHDLPEDMAAGDADRPRATVAEIGSDDEEAGDLLVDELLDVSPAWHRDDSRAAHDADAAHDDECHVLEIGEFADDRPAWFDRPSDDASTPRRSIEGPVASRSPVDPRAAQGERPSPARAGVLLTADPWASGGSVEFGTFVDGDEDPESTDHDVAARFEVPASDLTSLGVRESTDSRRAVRTERAAHGPIAGPAAPPAESRTHAAAANAERQPDFEDVPVVDRYARLDAGLSVEDLPTESWHRIVAGTTERRAVPVPSSAPAPASRDELDPMRAPGACSRTDRLRQTAAAVDHWSVSDPLVPTDRTADRDALAWPAPPAESEETLELEPTDEPESIAAFDPIEAADPRSGTESLPDPIAEWTSPGVEPGTRRLSNRRLDGFLRLLDEALASVVEPESEERSDTVYPEVDDLESATVADAAERRDPVFPETDAGPEDVEDRVSRDVLDVCRETRALVAGLESEALRRAESESLRGALPPRFDVVEPETVSPPAAPHVGPQRRYARLFSLLRGRRAS